MNIQAVNTAIITGKWTNQDLESMIDAVKYARARLTDSVKVGIKIGDTVSWTSTKGGGGTKTGTVQKVKQKYIEVRTATGLWNVPANMLSKVAAKATDKLYA